MWLSLSLGSVSCAIDLLVFSSSKLLCLNSVALRQLLIKSVILQGKFAPTPYLQAEVPTPGLSDHDPCLNVGP